MYRTDDRDNPYTERQRNVTQLGYRTYAGYLSSALWREIRQRVFAASRVCIRCGGLAVQVHHGSYSVDVLRGSDLSPLMPVCRSCHRRAESVGRKMDAERLQAVTVWLMTPLSCMPGRRRGSRTPARHAVPRSELLDAQRHSGQRTLRTHRKKRPVRPKAPFDATPRLVQRSVSADLVHGENRRRRAWKKTA